jgi:hypothetical protein
MMDEAGVQHLVARLRPAPALLALPAEDESGM